MLSPLIIAHRGASAVAPENTIAAFEAAIAAGADGIEFDVRLSRDGVPVVIHDETLYRTAGVRGRVSDMSGDQLNHYDVPSLAQLFELFQSNNLRLYLELKEYQLQLVEECCRLMERYNLKDRVIFECFDLSALEIVKNIDSSLRTAALFQRAAGSVIDQAIAVGASEIALHHGLVKAPLVDKAKLAGLEVVVWTVDGPAWVSRAKAHGIQALITNNPSALIAARHPV